VPAGVQAAWLRHVSASNSRAELAQLFEAASPLGTIRTANMETRDTIRAAALRFLAQIVPRDEHIGAVRSIMERPAPQTTTPADAGREGTRRSQPTQAAVQRALGRSRIELEPADVERLAARYVRALIDE